MSVDIRDHGGIYGGKGGKGGPGDDGGADPGFDLDGLIASSFNKTKNVLGAADTAAIPPMLRRVLKVKNRYTGSQPMMKGSQIYVYRKEGLENLPNDHPVRGVESIVSKGRTANYFAARRSGGQGVVFYKDHNKGRELEVRGINESHISSLYHIKEYDLLVVNSSWYDVKDPLLAKMIPPPENPHGISLNELRCLSHQAEEQNCRLFVYDSESGYIGVVNKKGSGYEVDIIEGRTKDNVYRRFVNEAFEDHEEKAKYESKIKKDNQDVVKKPIAKDLVFVTKQGEDSIYYFSVSKKGPSSSTWSTYILLKYKMNSRGRLVFQGHIAASVTGSPQVFESDAIRYGSLFMSARKDHNFNYHRHPKGTLRGQLVLTEDGQEYYIRSPFRRAQSYAGSGKMMTKGEYIEPATTANQGRPYYQSDYYQAFKQPPYIVDELSAASNRKYTLCGFPAMLQQQNSPDNLEEYYDESKDNMDYDAGNSVIGILLDYDSEYMTVFIL